MLNMCVESELDIVENTLLEGWMDGWMDGWVDGWMEAKAGLRIAYSNQKPILEKPPKTDFSCEFVTIISNQIVSI